MQSRSWEERFANISTAHTKCPSNVCVSLWFSKTHVSIPCPWDHVTWMLRQTVPHGANAPPSPPSPVPRRVLCCGTRNADGKSSTLTWLTSAYPRPRELARRHRDGHARSGGGDGRTGPCKPGTRCSGRARQRRGGPDGVASGRGDP